jgi:hypothetical protein
MIDYRHRRTQTRYRHIEDERGSERWYRIEVVIPPAVELPAGAIGAGEGITSTMEDVMATLRREWVSVEQAQQWLDTYDQKWMSDQVKDAIVRELKAHKKPRWYNAIIVDQQTNICHDGLGCLLAIVKAEQGQMCWVARADDFHFSAASPERTGQGYQLVTRKMDRVETTPLPLNIPARVIDADDLPEHLR